MLRGFLLFLSIYLLGVGIPFAEGEGRLIGDLRWQEEEKQKSLSLHTVEMSYSYALPIGHLYLQILNQKPTGEKDDLHIGEAWLKMRFADDKLFIKAGRIPLPFALNAVYDPHLEVIQPLYPQSLGLRLGEGVMAQGVYGPYLFMISACQKAKSSGEGNKVFSLRVSRPLPSNPFGRGEFGFSLLGGKLPYVDEKGIMTEKMVDKSRIGLDFSLQGRGYRLIGEGTTGADEEREVGGYFLLLEAPLVSPNLKFLASWRAFNFDQGKGKEVKRGGVGVKWGIKENVSLSYIYQRDYYYRKDLHTFQLIYSYPLR